MPIKNLIESSAKVMLLSASLIGGFAACSQAPSSEGSVLALAADTRYVFKLSPSSSSTKPGSSVIVNATLINAASTRATVASDFELSASGLPTGVKLNPEKPVIKAGTNSVSFSVEVDTTAKAGVYPIKFTTKDSSDHFGPSNASFNLEIKEVFTVKQFGSIMGTESANIKVDSKDNIYVCGYVIGSLPMKTAIGTPDFFLRKYDSTGNELWTEQFSHGKSGSCLGIAVDSKDNVYVAGSDTDPVSFEGIGSLYKYDGTGKQLWARFTRGTAVPGTIQATFANKVAVDASDNVYIAGQTTVNLPGKMNAGLYDAFIRQYKPDGTEGWLEQFGTVGIDGINDVVATSTDLYVTGITSGTLGATSSGGDDGFVRQYKLDGTLGWTDQFGTSATDRGGSITSGKSGKIYVTGSTYGTLPMQTSAGGADAFVRQYGPATSTPDWTKQFGTSGNDLGFDLALSPITGDIFVMGDTTGTFSGMSFGGEDTFIQQLAQADGTLLKARQLGTSGDDGGSGLAFDSSGQLYVTGTTKGTFPGETRSAGAGSLDAFVAFKVLP